MSAAGPRVIAALLRHGEYHQLPDTPSAHQPFPLDADGERQAGEGVAAVADILAAQRWDLLPDIDSSRLLRAWQTATLIAAGLAGEFVIEEFDALAERGVGTAANLSISQIEQALAADPRYEVPAPGWKADSHYRLPFPGAESLLDAGRRVADHLITRMTALRATTTIDTPQVKLFVGHGAAFRHAVYHLGVLEFEQLAALSMYHAQPVFLELLADGSWRHVAGDWKLRRPADAYRD
jgi:2,3-bisphosphoglycerate-dependent phosphoglycerate mutase